MMKRRFEGIIPPVTTPFSARGDLRLDLLERNVERYLGTDLAGLLLLGSNGESVHLSPAERLQLVKHVAPAVPDDRHLIVGMSASTLLEAFQTLEDLQEIPINYLLVSVPGYYRNRMNPAALIDYFSQVADRSPFEILLYNVPQYSGLEIKPEVVRELADHPKIVGMKDSSGNLHYVQHVQAAVSGSGFEIILGSAQVLGPGLVLGIRAAILAVACTMPDLPLRLLKEYLAGKDVGELQSRLFRVANAVTSLYGVPGLKVAMDLAGFAGGSCRAPLADLTDVEKAHLKELLA